MGPPARIHCSRQRNSRIEEPCKAVGVSQLAAIRIQIMENEPAVFVVELGGNTVKNGLNFRLVAACGILGDIQTVQFQNVILSGNHFADIMGISIGLHHIRHTAYDNIAAKQFEHGVVDRWGRRLQMFAAIF